MYSFTLIKLKIRYVLALRLDFEFEVALKSNCLKLFNKNVFSNFSIEMLKVISVAPGCSVPKYSTPVADQVFYKVRTIMEQTYIFRN